MRAVGCPPTARGAASAVRAALWLPLSGLFKLALAVETGTVRGHIVTQNLTFAAEKPQETRSGCPAGRAGQQGSSAERRRRLPPFGMRLIRPPRAVERPPPRGGAAVARAALRNHPGSAR